MADLKNLAQGLTTLGANYGRAEQAYSNYGTRQLAFYVVELAGYNLYAEDEMGNNDNYADPNDNDQGPYQNPTGSAIEAILRGVSLVAETYYVSWYDVDFDGEYPYSYITVAVASQTETDGNSDYITNNGYTLEGAIADALGNDFGYDYVNVYNAYINGGYFNWFDAGALPQKARTPGGAPKTAAEYRASRIAAGKTGVARRG